ncbi:MAG: hypothetical protein IPN95_30410 [Bacteroidetes bacterium]|nr:hypothetical protein [Bacteroidota bacterium]
MLQNPCRIDDRQRICFFASGFVRRMKTLAAMPRWCTMAPGFRSVEWKRSMAKSRCQGTWSKQSCKRLLATMVCCFGSEQFFSFIDEVRIWAVARTQAQIKHLCSFLADAYYPNGLVGYYSFNSAINLQEMRCLTATLQELQALGMQNPTYGIDASLRDFRRIL